MSAFREKGRILFFSHARYEQAEQEFLRALADDPDDAEAHAMLGLARNRLNRSEEALKSCQEAIRLAPEWSYSHYALGYVLEKNNRLEEAATALEEAIRLNPHTAYYHSHRAFTLHRLNRYTDALACAEEGLRCDGQHVDSLNRRAMALAALDRFEEAEQASRTAVALDPEDSGSLANLGYILHKRKQSVEALETLREALRLDPSMTWSREVTVDALELLIEQGRADEAAKHMPEAILRHPDQKADRARLLKAAMKPIHDRMKIPVGCAWILAVLATGVATQEFWLFVPLFILNIIDWRTLWSVNVLVERLSYPFALANPVAQLFLSTEQKRHFQRVALILGAGAFVGLGVAVMSSTRKEIITLLLFIALVMPTAYAEHPAKGLVQRLILVWYSLLAIVGAALLFATIYVGEVACQPLLLPAEVFFVVGVGLTGFVARLAQQLRK